MYELLAVTSCEADWSSIAATALGKMLLKTIGLLM
jgi:hypothetical protein